MATPTMKDSTGKRYKLVVLKVVSEDALGRPNSAILGYDDTTFQIEGGEKFITAWVPEDCVAPKVGGRA